MAQRSFIKIHTLLQRFNQCQNIFRNQFVLNRIISRTSNDYHPNTTYAASPVRLQVNQKYAQRCDSMLQRLANKATIFAPFELAFLPLDSVNCKKDATFIDLSVLYEYRRAVEANLKCFSTFHLVCILRGLAKMNTSSNAKIEELLGWDTILKITEICMTNLFTTKTPTEIKKNFGMLLHALRKFDRNTLTTGQDLFLKTTLSNALTEFVDIVYSNPDKYFDYSKEEQNRVGQILYYCTKFDVYKPPKETIEKIVAFYSKTHNVHKCTSDYGIHYVNDLYAIAQTFLYWNINPNNIEIEFWSRWLSEMQKHFPFIRQKLEARVVFLRTCLEVAIEFDEELAFNKMKFFWLDNMRLIKSYPNDRTKMLEQINSHHLLDKMNKKYFTGNTGMDFDKFGFQPLKILLESLTMNSVK